MSFYLRYPISLNEHPWGGDCWVAEATYGALKIFKNILSEVLGEMVNRVYLNIDGALEIASKILSENVAQIFNF